jgi:pantetheine-phosphate adenylyltransferase
MAKVMYAMSGDPVHYGHVDIVRRAADQFDEVIVGIGKNAEKKHLFSLEERVDMTEKALEKIPNAKVVAFNGLLADYVALNCVNIVVKGVRNSKDSEYEELQYVVNKTQIDDFETTTLVADEKTKHISSTVVKILQGEHGDIHEYVPLHVKQALEARMSGQYIVGVTGTVGTGKSYVSDKLVEIGKEKNIPVHNIDFDKLAHYILGNSQEPLYKKTREKIIETFGNEFANEDGSINRTALRDIVFDIKAIPFTVKHNVTSYKTNHMPNLEKLNDIMFKPIKIALRKELRNKKGLILFNAARIPDFDLTYMCNNNIVLVDTPYDDQKQRLSNKGLSDSEITTFNMAQEDTNMKKRSINDQIEKYRHGTLWEIFNENGCDPTEYENLFDSIVKEVDQYGELRFKALWNKLELNGSPDDAYQQLSDLYSQSSRRYHTIHHIVESLDLIDEHKDSFDNDSDVAKLACFYHDAIYDIFANDNEKRSAELFHKTVTNAGLSKELTEQGYNLILATVHDGSTKTYDEELFTDVDLVSLAREPDEFKKYANKIEEEYTNGTGVSKQQFDQGRLTFLTTFLSRNHIFSTFLFRGKYEAKAIENMYDEKDELANNLDNKVIKLV